MPKLPSWLADTMEKIISNKIFEVEVADTRMLSNNIKAITFKGDFLDMDFIPGKEVLFRVNANEYRHYTLSDFDQETGTCRIIFFLNRKGAGSNWAENIKMGDHVKLIADQAKVKYHFDSNQHFFFGDETSIGLYESFGKTAQDLAQEYFGILEMNEENDQALAQLGLLIDVVPSNMISPAEHAIEWMKNMHPKCWEMWKGASFYLTGRGKSVQKFKKYLKEMGVHHKQIQTTCYWENGKTGG
ncbi:siderophore-interacting protein [Pedobacter sp. GR22-10]|uniref:siderophore-interacting protein n=1 Tax=Pedobacter TaxID=84567 RepID=UPI0022471458|nr:siderophore-interacting protein [Pedobacter sp. GR22-10]MCX2432133.1 siderophore-interacting protein [Pedobacter sp. GR22-10]